MKRFATLTALLFMPVLAHASEGAERIDLTGNWVGITSVLLFFVAYLVVMAEEFTHLRKSKPVMLAGPLMHFPVMKMEKQNQSRQWSICSGCWINTLN